MQKGSGLFVLVLVLLLVVPTAFAQNFTITPAGKSSLQGAATATGDDSFTSLEFPPEGPDADADAPDSSGGAFINRTISKGPGIPASAGRGLRAKSNPVFQINFNGLNHRDQRLANGGNQFSLEPPDQGLCAGNGYVLESVNDALRVFDTGGHPLTGVIDLNTFYGYPPSINRTTGVFSAEVTDPSCYYDPQTQRWFHVALTLALTARGAFTGVNTLDLAVSDTSNPLGNWTIYHIHAENNGTNGTPDHQCSLGFCLGDYPHIGADFNGIYLTTNEFSFFGPGFTGSQIYALSKQALIAGGTVAGQLFNTGDDAYLFEGAPGFTVWPAVAPDGLYKDNTEYLLSSLAVFSEEGFDNRLREWTLTNTSSLNTASPAVVLSSRAVSTTGYGVPPRSTQKAGDFPLGQCINDTTTPVGGGLTGCWRLLFAAEPASHAEVESKLDSNDSRMQQVVYANGKLWGALDTGVTFDGVHVLAGIAYFVINPESGRTLKDGYIGIPNNNVTYPAVAVSPTGRGAIAFTLTGPDFYPSAAYSNLDAKVGVSEVAIARDGLGPQDGFSGYRAEANPAGSTPRPRWGDYGAAVYADGNIWLASEYIGQSCTLAQFMASPFGSCGGTRTTLANWFTSITAVSVK
jgi:hypothetical protein